METERSYGHEAWGREIIRLAKEYLHVAEEDGRFQLPMDVWLPLYARGLEPIQALDEALDAIFETELSILA